MKKSALSSLSPSRTKKRFTRSSLLLKKKADDENVDNKNKSLPSTSSDNTTNTTRKKKKPETPESRRSLLSRMGSAARRTSFRNRSNTTNNTNISTTVTNSQGSSSADSKSLFFPDMDSSSCLDNKENINNVNIPTHTHDDLKESSTEQKKSPTKLFLSPRKNQSVIMRSDDTTQHNEINVLRPTNNRDRTSLSTFYISSSSSSSSEERRLTDSTMGSSLLEYSTSNVTDEPEREADEEDDIVHFSGLSDNTTSSDTTTNDNGTDIDLDSESDSDTNDSYYDSDDSSVTVARLPPPSSSKKDQSEFYWKMCYGNKSPPKQINISTTRNDNMEEPNNESSKTPSNNAFSSSTTTTTQMLGTWSAKRAPPTKSCLSSKKAKKIKFDNNIMSSTCPETPKENIIQTNNDSPDMTTPNTSQQQIQQLLETPKPAYASNSVILKTPSSSMNNTEDSNLDTNITSTTRKTTKIRFGTASAAEFDFEQPSKIYTPLPKEVSQKLYKLDIPEQTLEEEEQSEEMKQITMTNNSVLDKWEDDFDMFLEESDDGGKGYNDDSFEEGIHEKLGDDNDDDDGDSSPDTTSKRMSIIPQQSNSRRKSASSLGSKQPKKKDHRRRRRSTLGGRRSSTIFSPHGGSLLSPLTPDDENNTDESSTSKRRSSSSGHLLERMNQSGALSTPSPTNNNNEQTTSAKIQQTDSSECSPMLDTSLLSDGTCSTVVTTRNMNSAVNESIETATTPYSNCASSISTVVQNDRMNDISMDSFENNIKHKVVLVEEDIPLRPNQLDSVLKKYSTHKEEKEEEGKNELESKVNAKSDTLSVLLQDPSTDLDFDFNTLVEKSCEEDTPANHYLFTQSKQQSQSHRLPSLTDISSVLVNNSRTIDSLSSRQYCRESSSGFVSFLEESMKYLLNNGEKHAHHFTDFNKDVSTILKEVTKTLEEKTQASSLKNDGENHSKATDLLKEIEKSLDDIESDVVMDGKEALMNLQRLFISIVHTIHTEVESDEKELMNHFYHELEQYKHSIDQEQTFLDCMMETATSFVNTTTSQLQKQQNNTDDNNKRSNTSHHVIKSLISREEQRISTLESEIKTQQEQNHCLTLLQKLKHNQRSQTNLFLLKQMSWLDIPRFCEHPKKGVEFFFPAKEDEDEQESNGEEPFLLRWELCNDANSEEGEETSKKRYELTVIPPSGAKAIHIDTMSHDHGCYIMYVSLAMERIEHYKKKNPVIQDLNTSVMEVMQILQQLRTIALKVSEYC